MGTDNISGYCMLSMPSDEVKPLGLLSFQEKGIANITGIDISDIFIKSEIALPFISKDHNLSTAINKSVTMELSVDSHLSLLESLLKFIKLSASFKLEKNKSVRITMTDAKKNNVNEFKLDAYINSAKVNDISPTYVEMLKNNELFVITDILKCSKYSLEYVDNKTTNAGIGVGAPLVGDADASLITGNANNDSFGNTGDTFLTIGVKAFRIFYVKDEKTGKESFRIRLDDNIKTIKGDEGFPGEVLNSGTTVITTK